MKIEAQPDGKSRSFIGQFPRGCAKVSQSVLLSRYLYQTILFEKGESLSLGLLMNGKPNIIKKKSYRFALEIISLYRQMIQQNEFTPSKQLIRSGTSVVSQKLIHKDG